MKASRMMMMDERNHPELCKNEKIRVFPYIPPYFVRIYSDKFCHTFIARKADRQLKTMIRLGNDDLILKTKLKNETDLNIFGKIGDIDLKIK